MTDIENLRALRDLQLKLAAHNINEHFDALERGEEPPAVRAPDV